MKKAIPTIILGVFIIISFNNGASAQVPAMTIDNNGNIKVEKDIFNKMNENGQTIYAKLVDSKIIYGVAGDDVISLAKGNTKTIVPSYINMFKSIYPTISGTKVMWRFKVVFMDMNSNHENTVIVVKNNESRWDLFSFEIPKVSSVIGGHRTTVYTDLKDISNTMRESVTSKVEATLHSSTTSGPDIISQIFYVELQQFLVLE